MTQTANPIRRPALHLDLPSGWAVKDNPGGPLEYVASSDGSTGSLQISRVSDEQLHFISSRPSLGEMAAQLGGRMPGWGQPVGSRDGTCAIGRLGMAIFAGGEFPAALMWLVASPRSAYLFTWVGPDSRSREVEQALQIVVSATERRPTVSAQDEKLIDALDAVSLARTRIAEGTSPEQLMLAMLLDADERISGQERPVVAARFERSAGDDLAFHCRLEDAPDAVVTLRVSSKTAPRPMHFLNLFTREQADLGDRSAVQVTLERGPGGYLQGARLRVASLWSLEGQRIDVPYEPARFEATVLGVRLTKVNVPASFAHPGSGSWVLLKTLAPDELYVAFSLEEQKLEIFPKTPLVPNAAALSLFKAL